MQLLHLTRPFLIVFLASRASAAPWVENDDHNFAALPFHLPADRQSYTIRKIFPQLTWLRDTAIEKLFGVPSKNCHSRHDVPTSDVPFTSKAQLPPSLLARYGGDLVLRFNLTTPDEERALAEAADTLFLDVWEFTSNWADIRLREDDVPSLLGLLPQSLQKAHSNLMPDLARNIYNSYPYRSRAEPAAHRNQPHHHGSISLQKTDEIHNLFFNDYQPLSVILPWMRLMASMFTSHVQMINIGQSYEGRDIPALRVGVSPAVRKESYQPRKSILVAGGSHAREWVSVSTVTYIAWSLITSYGKLPSVTKLLEEFDFIFIPTMNPDGYVYTWETDRLWRKNRQDTTLRFCRGLDLDRGFGFEWDGTSFQANPCSESYPGDEPFQAVESRRLADWAKNETDNNNVNFVGFLDFHSYSQQVLYPYSYSCSKDPPSLENLEELGMGLAKAIRISSGEQYGVASACEGAVASKRLGKAESSRMETGGGSAIDWFYHEMRVRYSYQIKLRDTGSYGFLLPKENIVPTGEEALDAVRYFGDFLLGNKGIERIDMEVEVGAVLSDADSDGVREMAVVSEVADAEEDSVTWE